MFLKFLLIYHPLIMLFLSFFVDQVYNFLHESSLRFNCLDLILWLIWINRSGRLLLQFLFLLLLLIDRFKFVYLFLFFQLYNDFSHSFTFCHLSCSQHWKTWPCSCWWFVNWRWAAIRWRIFNFFWLCYHF